ncbi:hypothetical protein GQ54DRAFT_93219 [Martensiomyces pterosporus]|nr:hypothetical protein GQ54DRAFT_93219 [Martensiomyces pterosporus]
MGTWENVMCAAALASSASPSSHEQKSRTSKCVAAKAVRECDRGAVSSVSIEQYACLALLVFRTGERLQIVAGHMDGCTASKHTRGGGPTAAPSALAMRS